MRPERADERGAEGREMEENDEVKARPSPGIAEVGREDADLKMWPSLNYIESSSPRVCGMSLYHLWTRCGLGTPS